MEILYKRLANLLSVKSLVTLALTVTFCVLTVQNAIPDNFLNIYTMIITFYFVKQLNAEGKDGNLAAARQRRELWPCTERTGHQVHCHSLHRQRRRYRGEQRQVLRLDRGEKQRALLRGREQHLPKRA